MQIAKQFDPTTVKKIAHSALIALGAFAAAFLTVMGMQLQAYLEKGVPLDWRVALAAGLTAVFSWIIASIKQWLKGEDPSLGKGKK